MKKSDNARTRFRFFGGLWLVIACLGSTTVRAQTASYVLGTQTLAVGAASGSNSVVLGVSPATASWTATNNAAWLQLDSSNQSGLGSGVVVFTFDANSGGPRTGSLTIGDQTLSITQAGTNYVQVASVATLVAGLTNLPSGIAVDGAGNVYFSETGTQPVTYPSEIVQEWLANSGTVTTLISSNLTATGYGPSGIAVDSMGDVYVTDGQTGTIEECYVTNHIVETLIPGLSKPLGAAVDNVGNVYTTDTGANLALEWSANTGALGQLSIDGLNHPTGVAVDVAGNVYIANANTTLYELSPSNDRTILVSQPTLTIGGVAVDGSGNAYMASGTILERSYLNTNLATLVAIGLNGAQGVAVNPSGDLFIADTGHEAIKELPRAFIDPTSKLEGLGSGSDTLPAVVSATTNLLATLPPTSDSAWLTITGVTNGLVSYSFTSTATNRTGHINLLGQAVSITQGEPAFALGTSSIVETSGEGSDSVVLAADSGPYPWTATDNDSWLHVSPGFQSGNVATNVIFSFDENTGATRTGTLTIAGQTLTVTQAGSSYLPAGALTTLCSGNEPDDVAVDTNGNVYFANFGDNSISEWNPVTDKVTKVITSGLGGPEGIASDGMGNIYIDDSYGASIYELIGGSAPLTTLVKSPTIFPNSLAVDNNGNIYYFNVNGPVNPGINSRTASTGALIFLPGFSTHALAVAGVAVDRAGNLYVGEGPILRSSGITSSTNWTPAVEPAVTTLVTAASNSWWLTVDGSGNIYSTSSGNPSTVYKWSAASNIVTTLAPSGLGFLGGITVDALGNLYANTGSNPVVELPQAFVDPTPKVEGPAGGSDSLPPVLPLTENLRPPFAPTSDQSWLTITDVTNGVVSFSFTANTGPARSANINLLGQEISVTQTGTGSSAPTFTGVQILGDGGIELHGITTGTSSTFTVLTSTDMALPLNEWTVCGTITNGVTGPFQFTPPPATNDLQRFYVIRSP